MTDENCRWNETGPNNGAVIDFRPLISELILITVPQKRLRKAKSISVDQTAFDSFYRGDDFRVQAEVDRTIEEARLRGEDISDQFDRGPDGKLIRSADKDARGGRRSASAATGYRAVKFNGYWVTVVALARSMRWGGKPGELQFDPKEPFYILGLAVDPASAHCGRISAEVIREVLKIAPNVEEVIADRGITQFGEEFVRPMRQLGLKVTMDCKSDVTSPKPVTVVKGKHRQVLLRVGSEFHPPWLPAYFMEPPKGCSGKDLKAWHQHKAQLRYSCNQSLDAGAVQLECPQCKGWVVTNLKTHNKNVQVTKNAISLRIKHPGDNDPEVTYDGEHHSSKCCEGLASISVENLDLWQEPPWGTPDWKASYGRRLTVETGNSKLKADGAWTSGSASARPRRSHPRSVDGHDHAQPERGQERSRSWPTQRRRRRRNRSR